MNQLVLLLFMLHEVGGGGGGSCQNEDKMNEWMWSFKLCCYSLWMGEGGGASKHIEAKGGGCVKC